MPETLWLLAIWRISLLNVSCEQADLEERHVLFMPDGGQVYLKKMFERIT